MSKVSVEAQGMKNRSYITCLLLPALILMLFAGCSFFKSGSHKSQAQTQDDWRLKHPRGSEYYALFEEAMKLQEDGKSVEALKKAEKVVQMVPDDIGHDLQMLMGSLYINTGQPKKAEKYVNMLIENNPDDPVALDMKVNMLCNLLEYDEAKRTAEKILKLPRAPKNIKLGAYLAMGYSAFMREHKYDEAEKYFQQARKISPGEPRVLFALADLAGMRGQYDKNSLYLAEIEKRKQYLDRDQLLELYKNLAYSNIYIGKFEKAREEYKKALKIAPDDYDIALQLAYMCVHNPEHTFDFETAQIFLGDLTRTHPNNPKVAMVAGVLWISEGRLYRALKIMEDAKGYAVKNGEFAADLWWSLANFYRTLGRYNDAEVLYREYINIQPDATEAYLGLAACLLAKGREAEAGRLFAEWGAKLQETRPYEMLEVYLMKAMVYIRNPATYDKAEENVRMFMKLANKESFEPYVMMGLMDLLLHKNLFEANANFDRALSLGKPGYYVHLEVASMCTRARYGDMALRHVLASEKELDGVIPPVKAGMLYRGAYILYAIGESQQALRFAEKAAGTDPAMTEGWVLISRLYRQSGDKKKAEEALNKALSLESDNKEALFEKENPGKINPYFLFPD